MYTPRVCIVENFSIVGRALAGVGGGESRPPASLLRRVSKERELHMLELKPQGMGTIRWRPAFSKEARVCNSSRPKEPQRARKGRKQRHRDWRFFCGCNRLSRNSSCLATIFSWRSSEAPDFARNFSN